MISTIKGKIKYKGNDFIVLEVNDIGYKIKIPAFVLNRTTAGKQNSSSGDFKIEENEKIEIFTYLYVRENELSLYGFKTMEEEMMFETLLLVSGIGPKVAFKILSIVSPKILKEAIFKGDKNILSKTAGISERIAQRIISDLKGKIQEIKGEENGSENISDISEAIDALMVLGYTRADALSALEKIPVEIKDLSERVKLALKNLGRQHTP